MKVSLEDYPHHIKILMKAVKISFLVSFVVDNIHSIVAAALYVVGFGYGPALFL